jgi:hypothetical protein
MHTNYTVVILLNRNDRENLAKNSPSAYCVSAAICEHAGVVHYVSGSRSYVSGIVEFMTPHFLKQFHHDVYKASQNGQDFSIVNWNRLQNVVNVTCVPLSIIFHKAYVTHINLFVLDVEVGVTYLTALLKIDVSLSRVVN